MLEMTERMFRRWSDRHDTEEAEGLQHRRLGRSSAQVAEALRPPQLHQIVPPGFLRRELAVEFGGRSQGLHCPSYNPRGQFKSR